MLQAVDGDRTRLDGGPVEPSRLARHREWWVLNGDPSHEGRASLPPRAQLVEAGYVLRHTSRMVMSQPRPGIPDDVVELERWQRAP